MGANEYFERFIIKQIVSKIDFDPKSEEYSFNDIHISDEIIKVIEDEGLRYGMQNIQTRELLSRVAGNISTKPSIQIRNNRVDVAEIKMGQHLRININHSTKGKLGVELMALEPSRFMVLGSDISGVQYGDILEPMDKVWNHSYSIEFIVFRNGIRIPDSHSRLMLGKIDSVELFLPSVVNEILDSKESYSFDGGHPFDLDFSESQYDSSLEGDEDLLDTIRKYNVWQPSKWGEDTIVFDWKEEDTQQDDSTFIILDDSMQRKAKILFNSSFKLPEEEVLSIGIIEIIQSCCKARNEFTGLSGLKYIKPMKEGILKRVKDDVSSKEWILEIKPQVKFVYEKEK